MLENNKFNLYLIRHAESEANIVPDQIGGFASTKLTKHGEAQAKFLGDRLYEEGLFFNKIYSSDYVRAYDTAKIATKNDKNIILSNDIREYSAGDWNGQSRNKNITPDILLKMGLLTNTFLPPNGESMHMVERRASQWLENTIIYNKEIIKEAYERDNAGLNPLEIAVFTHGMTIKCLLHYIMGFDTSFTWKLTIENTSITKLCFDKNGWRLLTINDYSHLPKCMQGK